MPLSDPPSTFGLAVGGVGFQIHLPDAAWLAALTPLYREFPLEEAVDWRVTVSPCADLASTAPRRIEHHGALTRFQTNLYTGWIDLAQKEAVTRPVSLDAAPAALESVLAYACMQTLPRMRCSLLLHAAGVHWQGRGLVLSGHAGAGKTTVARLAQGYGELFNDEMVILDLAGPAPHLLSTPFVGPTTPPELVRRSRRSAPASALLLLAYAPDFELTRLSPAEATLELLRTNLAAVERTDSAAAWLAAVERLTQALPAYQLRFRPTAELWAFLAGALRPAAERPLCAS
jgi:hypothetical protein